MVQLLKVAYSFSRSFSTDTHRKKTSVRRKANKCVVIVQDKIVRTKDVMNKGLMRELREIVDKFFLSA